MARAVGPAERRAGHLADRTTYPILPVEPKGTFPASVPRVFISHPQTDRGEALRIAELVQQRGYDYWLDILNPELLSIPNIQAWLTTPHVPNALLARKLGTGATNPLPCRSSP